MNIPYLPSTIEKWVSEKFIAANIIYPSDLDPERVAAAFNIDYISHFGKAFSYRSSDDSEAFIVEDKNADEMEQRLHFFHELGHILRHAGDQCDMSESFRMMQEADAALFSMYAAVPYHMIDFEKGYTAKSIMAEFHVTRELAYNRIEDIRQKVFWEQQRQREKFQPVYTPFTLKKCSNETKRIMRQLSNQTGVKYL